ncbi:MAG: hypothetical protein KAJ19_10670 [Gammaproteobacteria bacterium]|nr:hypothetical protein [Gammaproteobacteria bacterium]
MIHRTEGGVPSTTSKHITKYITESDNVPSMGFDSTYITPPGGKVWQILHMHLIAAPPFGASSGTHDFTLNIDGTLNILKGSSVFGSSVEWDYSQWNVADHEQKPSDGVTALNALISTYIIKEEPLRIAYSNFTDVTQGSMRILFFSILETPLI